ncbi:MAG TPA: hypothetical protein VGC89_20560 [Pyrinomonadaceae bacterium]|jgi:hypothetical protein
MLIRFMRRMALSLVALLVVGLCFAEAGAQTTRNKRSRRATNPVATTTTTNAPPVAQPTPPPVASDARIISTADDPLADDLETDAPPVTTRRTGRSRGSVPASDAEQQDTTRRTVNRLSRQVDKLSDKINQIEGQQRALVDLERLSRAEQRAEAFRAQLRDVEAKEAELQSRLEQIDYDLKPENIERSASFYGTTRPEDVRDARRRQLENERGRIQSQLNLISTSRTRLESAIALADTEVERLRARLDTDDPVTKQPTANGSNEGDSTNTDQTTSSDTPATNSSRPARDAAPSGTP